MAKTTKSSSYVDRLLEATDAGEPLANVVAELESEISDSDDVETARADKKALKDAARLLATGSTSADVLTTMAETAEKEAARAERRGTAPRGAGEKPVAETKPAAAKSTTPPTTSKSTPTPEAGKS